MSLLDLSSKIRKLLRLPAQNLKAWGQVATQPKLRQEYAQQVAKPAVQRVTQPIKRFQETRPRPIQAGAAEVGRFLQKAPEYKIPKERVVKPLRPFTGLAEWGPRMVGSQIRSYGKTLEEVATQEGRKKAALSLKKVLTEKPSLKTLEEPAVRWAFDVPDILPGGFLFGATIKELGEKGARELAEKAAKEIGEKGAKEAIPEGLESLAKEARKYKSAEDFTKKLKDLAEQARGARTAEAGIRSLPKEDRFLAEVAIGTRFQPEIIESFAKKYGHGEEAIKDFYNQVTKGVGPSVKIGKKISEPLPSIRIKGAEELPQVRAEAGLKKAVSPSEVIIPRDEKYAFNINKKKLGLTGEPAQKLDATVKKMRPILEQRKGMPLTDEEIIRNGRKADVLGKVMGREEAAEFSSKLQATRNYLKTASGKKGITPEYLSQIDILSSTAADTGRRLRSFAVNAEDVGIKQAIIKDLKALGIETKRLVEAGKRVDWNDANQVTEFYRKFKPATFAEKLQEYRYVNMLSSPNTHLSNTFSNFLQSAIVKPVEKTITGQLDWVRSRLTGSEQKYFARQGVDYAKGYWKSLPEAWTNFRSTMAGEGGLRKPDIDFIPTGTGRVHKLFTTPLRALEASDQFFKALVIGGEKRALKDTVLTTTQIAKKAEASAEYTLFRQAFDPDGKLGQGGLLKLWDKWNVGISRLRRLPGGKWVVPFLQTPTNILKQGVEYSPLGVATIPGAKEPLEQLSKAIIGTSVFAGAYALANSGLTTWDTPTSSKKRQEFYAAGLQPYSVKIGDKWVSYSKLGPLSYPMAMASAMKWAKDNGAEENFLKQVGIGMGGFLQFFADQSYMQGIGDVIDAVRGDEFKQGRALSNIPSQVIPYRALQGWIARLVDPVYRKSSGGGVVSQATKSIMTQIPFVSKMVEPYTTPQGEISKRDLPFLNAISPLRISREKQGFKISPAGKIQSTIKIALPESTEDLGVLYKNAQGTIDRYGDKRLKIEHGLISTDVEDVKADMDKAIALKKRIEKEHPDQVLDIHISTYKSGGGQLVEDRAKWVAETLEGLDDKARQEMVNRLWDEKVITKGAKGVAQYLEDNLGLNVWGYTGTSKGGAKAKKPKAITIKKVTIPKLKVSGTTRKSKLPALKIAKPPTLKTTARKATKISMPTYKAPTIKIGKTPTLTVGRYK